MKTQPYLEVHGQGALRNGEDANSCFRLPQLVVDGDEGLHRGLGRAAKLQLLVVQRLGEGVALLRQRAQRPAGCVGTRSQIEMKCQTPQRLDKDVAHLRQRAQRPAGGGDQVLQRCMSYHTMLACYVGLLVSIPLHLK